MPESKNTYPDKILNWPKKVEKYIFSSFIQQKIETKPKITTF